MLNTDIFKFEFVDRMEERQIIDNFLADFSTPSGYALWLHGKRGIGKSFFLKEYLMPQKSFTSVYTNIELGNNTPGTYLKSFVSQINNAADLKLINYLRANYKSVAEIGQKAFNIILNLADLEDTGLDELGASISNYYISKRGEKENSVTVIKKYITEALKKCGKIVFILDNFSQCDASSLEVISALVHELISSAYIRFIICTTDDDLETRFDIKSTLAERIPNKALFMPPFSQKQLFARMLEHTFDLDSSNVNLLTQAFELCCGIPQRFKEILINIYAAQGIFINHNKAYFVQDIFKQILLKREISFDIDALCKEKKGAKTVLQVIAFWGAPISPRVLYEFLDFLADSEFITSVLRKEIETTLQTLEEMHILTRVFIDNTVLIQFEHDSLKVAVSEYFKNDRFISFLHFSIYEYLMNCIIDLNKLYWQKYHKALLAYHSFASKSEGWIELNYNYGYAFFEAKLYREAEEIFSRFESVITALSAPQLLIIGITLYYCGNYHKSDDILSIIETRFMLNELPNDQALMLYIYQSRARTCILDNKRALAAIEKAEKLPIIDDELYVKLMGAKQSSLYMTPGKFNEAKKIFDDLVKQKLPVHAMAILYQSSMDYYEGKKAKQLLNRGRILARSFNDHVTEGNILNNMGFESLRGGDYEKARAYFEKSIAILKEFKPHEQVYPYSNLAVLHMILGNWEQALNEIVEALFWNRSDYASLVLKTNRMLCYYYLENRNWERLYDELYKYIDSDHYVDDKIYKKICINIALLASKSQNRFDEAKNILEKCQPHLELEWPHGKYRFLKLYQTIAGTKEALVLPRNKSFFG